MKTSVLIPKSNKVAVFLLTLAGITDSLAQNFSEHIISGFAVEAHAMHAADMDGDSDMDILTTGWGQDEIVWLENTGGPDFIRHLVTDTFDNGYGVYGADIDSDGDMDIAGAARDADKISWFENDGNMQFTEHILSNTYIAASDVIVVDLDQDNDMDLVSASRGDDEITFWENDGNENFTRNVVRSNYDGANLVYAEDIDKDGDIDIAGAKAGAFGFGSFDWWENDGNENFTNGTNLSGTIDEPSEIHVADVDDDGDFDILGTGYDEDLIAWWENDGSQNFSKRNLNTNFNGARGVHAGDVDGDGDTDILGAAYFDDDITMYENDGAGSFTEHVISGSTNGASSVLAVDINGDSKLDIVGGAVVAYRVYWWDVGVPPLATEYAVSPSFSAPSSVHTVDLDGDGDPDVVSSATSSDAIGWFENTGNRNLDQQAITYGFDGADDVFGADIDGDNDIDVLAGATADNELAWWENDGNQSFTKHSVVTNYDATAVWVEDIDDDGDMDLAAVADWDDMVSWFENDGNENFTQHDLSTNYNDATDIMAIDLDKDGDMDLLSSRGYYALSANDISWWENDDDENFTQNSIVADFGMSRTVFATDMDGDNDIDVLGTNRFSSAGSWWDNVELAWWENDGSQQFTKHQVLNGSVYETAHAADMDNDNDIDIVMGTNPTGNGWVYYLENDGSMNFTSNALGPMSTHVTDVLGVDMDGDGFRDIVTSGSRVSIWFNECGPVTPGITVNGPVTFCSGGSTELVSNSANTYEWLHNGLSTGVTTQNFTVTAGGSYEVVVQDCSGTRDTATAVNITVNQLPTASVTPSGSIGMCTGETTLLSANTGAGFAYQWYKDLVMISGATQSTYTVSQAGSYHIEITENGCTGVSNTVVVQVSNKPNAVIIPAGPTSLCDGETVILDANSGTGLTYQWYKDAAVIVGATIPSYAVTQAGSYTVLVSHNGCDSLSPPVIVTVSPLPTVSFSGLDPSYCEDDALVTLTGSPSNGTFTGNGMNGDQFDPAAAGTGTHTITYAFTDANNCTNSEDQQVTVHGLPVVSMSGLDPEYCLDHGLVMLSGSPGGGTFSGDGVSGSQFDPGVAGLGVHTVTYTYTDANNCTNDIEQAVSVNANPALELGADTSICGACTLTLDAGNPGSTYQWSTGESTQKIEVSDAGTYWVQVTDGTGCTQTDTILISAGVSGVGDFGGYYINVYPNPFDQHTVIHFPVISNWQVQLFDVTGRLVVNITDAVGKNISIYRNDLPAGIYWLAVTLDDRLIHTQKLVIIDKKD